MTDNKVCPSCGATLDNNVGSQCPFCGSALDTPAVNSSSAQTMISSRPLSKKAEFDNSAEAMDEIKKLVREGDEAGATMIAGQQFDLKPEDAKNTVEQVAEELKYSGGETMLAGHSTPPPPPPVTDQAAYSTPPAAVPASFSTPPAGTSFVPETPKADNKKKWIIGGSIGAVVFLCLCCCLPLIASFVMMRRGN